MDGPEQRVVALQGWYVWRKWLFKIVEEHISWGKDERLAIVESISIIREQHFFKE